jgi:DNA-binding transcriptional ArsR family regulator
MKSNEAIDALGALAQETRLAIFRLLVRQGPGGLPAGTIAERLEIPAPTMSFHLAYLSRAGLVTSRREGRSILYAADYRGMNALLTYLTEDCCQGRPEICRTGAVACGPAAQPRAAATGDSHEAPARVRRR